MYRRWPSAYSVSNARLDLPEPETPVTTVMALWGIVTSIFFRLWTRAPRTRISSTSPGTPLAGFTAGSAESAGTGFPVSLVGISANEKLYARAQARANGRVLRY